MKETKEKDKTDISLICSICHKNTPDIKLNHSKLKKLYNEKLKNDALSELIIKCNCFNDKLIIKNKYSLFFVCCDIFCLLKRGHI